MSTTIDLLNRQIKEIASLRDLPSSDTPQFKQWQQVTITIIERKLGKVKANKFPSSYEFWPNRVGPWDPEELKESLLEGLETAQAYLSGLIQEIELLGEITGEEEQKKTLPKENRYGNVTVSGGNVIFGNGGQITQVAVKELVDALSKEIEEKVDDGEEKTSVLKSLKSITTNETFASVAGVFIGEVLKKLSKP